MRSPLAPARIVLSRAYRPFFSLTAAAVLVLAGARTAPFPDAASVEVTYLANEGYLVRTAEHAVILDGFVAKEYAGYPALSAEILAQLLEGNTPFDTVDLALVSHVHGDHFQPRPAGAFLRSRPDVPMPTSPQVIESLPSADREVLAEQLIPILPEPGETKSYEHAGVRVRFLRLSHGTGRFASIQNLGHVVEMDGARFLHLGDAAMDPKEFAPYALAEEEFDVAFVPYWYFADPVGLRILKEHVRARQLVACHVPDREEAALAKRLAAHPGKPLVFRECGETHSFGAR